MLVLESCKQRFTGTSGGGTVMIHTFVRLVVVTVSSIEFSIVVYAIPDGIAVADIG